MNNRTQICKILRENGIIKTELEKIFYVYDSEKKEFYRPKLDTLKKLKVGEFLNVEPINNDEVSKLKAKPRTTSGLFLIIVLEKCFYLML